MHKALREFGAPLNDLTVAELKQPGIVFQMGLPPNRIGILTGIDGVGFDEAWPDRQESRYGDQPIDVLGREHLIQSKLAAGRPQDLVDVEELKVK